MKLDHIAISSSEPKKAAKWYCDIFGASIIYEDDTWSAVQFENIKISFVLPEQHPEHIAFEVSSFADGEIPVQHRDGSLSVIKSDPWGNYIEFIKYKTEEK